MYSNRFLHLKSENVVKKMIIDMDLYLINNYQIATLLNGK